MLFRVVKTTTERTTMRCEVERERAVEVVCDEEGGEDRAWV